MPFDLVGRSAELAQLTAVLDEGGQALVLSGPAGIGKSALISYAEAEAKRRGSKVLQVIGVQAEVDVPYAGLERLLRTVLPASPRRSIDRLLLDEDNSDHGNAGASSGGAGSGANSAGSSNGEAHNGSGASGSGASGSGASGGGAEDRLRHYRVALAVLELLDRERTVVLADDAQWLDEESWQVLTYVARRLDGEAIVLLLGMRDSTETTRRLKGAGLRELPIGPLDADAAEQIVPSELPTLLRYRVLEEAGGNPLGLRELSAAAAAIGERALLPTGLPLSERLNGTFLATFDELPARTRHLLRVAAFHDRDDADEILRAAGFTAADLQPALDARLAEAGDDAVRLRHPLIRSALVRSTPAADRRDIHAALAAVVADPDRRTWHLAAAATGPDAELAEALTELARQARARGAVEAAIAAWERAAELSPDPDDRANRYFRASASAFDVGDTAVVARLAEVIDASRLGARERLWLSWAHNGVGGDADVTNARLLTNVEAAREALTAGYPDDVFDILSGIVLQLYFTPLEPEVRDAVIRLVEDTGLGTEDARVAGLLGIVAPFTHGKNVLSALPRHLSAPPDGPDYQNMLVWGALGVGALGAAKALVAHAVAESRARQMVANLTQALVTEAWVGVFGADAHLIDRSAGEAARLATETGQPRWVLVATLARGMASALRGDQAAAEQIADMAMQAFLATGAHGMVCLVQLVRGTAALGSGNGTVAFDHLSRMFDERDMAYHPTVRLWAIGSLAEAAILAGRVDELRPILDGLDTSSELPALTRGLACATAMLGQAGSSEEMAAFDQARVDYAYGVNLRRERQHGRARPYLRAATSIFDALGAEAWSVRARQELRATGETVRRNEAGSDALTAQEAQIAELAAQGLTNKEIGRRLFLSPRTVGSHLYRIFPKLGITTRGELAAALDNGRRD